MRRSFSLTLVFLLLSVLFLAACGGNGDKNTATPEPTEVPTEAPTEAPAQEETEDPNMSLIPEAIEVQSDFTILVEAFEAADLIDLLSGNIQHTLFAPTDAAFEAYFEAQNLTKDEFLEDTEALTDLLYYHIVAEWLDTTALAEKDSQSLTTLNGEPLIFAIDDAGEVTLNGTVAVVFADVIASSGVIHAIDTVLTGPVVVEPEEPMEPTVEATAEATIEMDAEVTEEPVGDPTIETTEEPEATESP